MIIEYQNVGEFTFLPKVDGGLEGNIVLDKKSRQKLKQAIEQEDENWWADEEGIRLSEEMLLKASPWSLKSQSNSKKVLVRYININNGEIIIGA